LDPGDLPPEYLDRVRQTPAGESAVCVFLATDIPPEDLAVQGCAHFYVAPDWDGIAAGDRSKPGFFARSPVEVSIPCLHDPSLAPEGKSGIIVSALAAYDYADRWGTAGGPSGATYEALKEEVAAQLIATTEQVIPGLSRRVQFRMVATPLTYERYTWNADGAVCGWTCDPRTTFHREAPGTASIKASILSPVDRLLLAGHWAFYPGGAPVGILTGRLAAEHIVQSLKKRGNRHALTR
jgi:phytoene dehydrogenase-like protein